LHRCLRGVQPLRDLEQALELGDPVLRSLHFHYLKVRGFVDRDRRGDAGIAALCASEASAASSVIVAR
jgi:hypothetical protein